MRNQLNVEQLCCLPISYIGFIFYSKSPRFVGDDFAPSITQSIPPSIKKVGVFVNASHAYIEEKINKYELNCVQLHGCESPDFCAYFKKKNITTIKAFGIDEDFDFATLDSYDSSCDYFLFDTKSSAHGGTGQKFDWEILKKYNNTKPIFLSGGITIDDASTVKGLTWLNIQAIDINSKFERAPALKDIEQIKDFITRVNAL